VVVLTRRASIRAGELHWDGTRSGDWSDAVSESDVVVNACGYGLEHWPWTPSTKRRFVASRVEPGRALAASIAGAKRRPRAFVQFSGINRYGLLGNTMADESTPAADDFLAQITVGWEAATERLADVGVRHIIVRNAIVLDSRSGLFPIMSLPSRLFLGGRLGSGEQMVPWIHLADHVRAIHYLIDHEDATGPYNLVAPSPATSDEFMSIVCRMLRRPYWLHVPAWVLRLALGEMSQLVLAGRAIMPSRLLEAGFQFVFPGLEQALGNILAGATA